MFEKTSAEFINKIMFGILPAYMRVQRTQIKFNLDIVIIIIIIIIIFNVSIFIRIITPSPPTKNMFFSGARG